ncbi:MAG: iron ABC transporter permease [Deltaproteobacteria bacterium]|nr:iron ABC transporter permease [Candidatus Anaeroferrophillacea bacterium]
MTAPAGIDLYHRRRRRRQLWLAGAALLLAGAALVAMTTGAISVSPDDFLGLFGEAPTGLAQRVIWHVRLPRVVGALLGGTGFAVAGMVLQAILRNPLASPSTLGISQGAAFGAACGIMLLSLGDAAAGSQGVQLNRSPALVTLLAFGCSLATTACIVGLAALRRAGREAIVLAGVALGAFFMAGTTVIQYFADETQLASIVQWTFGDVSRATWPELRAIAVVVTAGTGYFFSQSLRFNALLAGGDVARSLGVAVSRLRLGGMVVAALMTAVIVTFFGVISFIGLVAPHMARMLVGEDARTLLPLTALIGAVLLLGADVLGRLLLAPVVLPAGVVTAFMGTPVFLFLLFGGRGSWR